MAATVVFCELLFIYLICLCCHSCCAYRQYSLENGKLCSLLFTKGKIKLAKNNLGAIVKETRYFDNWSGDSKFSCKFEVEDSMKNTIFAVIQKLSFRKDEDGTCIDYVKFIRDDKIGSIEYCGEISAFKPPTAATDTSYIESNINAFNAFIDPQGEMDVHIYVADKRLLANESIDLNIAFTSSQECYKSPTFYQSCGGNDCINSLFFGDGVVNCPYADCIDEGGCINQGIHGSNEGTKVAIGAIATVLISFLCFFACIWMLRRYRKMCWSSEFSNPTALAQLPAPAGMSRVETVGSDDEGEPQVLQHRPQPAPSAPPVDETTVTILNDKDLPPPYDSLFPSR